MLDTNPIENLILCVLLALSILIGIIGNVGAFDKDYFE